MRAQKQFTCKAWTKERRVFEAMADLGDMLRKRGFHEEAVRVYNACRSFAAKKELFA